MKTATDPILERGLPSDIETERLVLGAALLDAGENLGSIMAVLTESDFCHESHRRTYAAILAVHEGGGTPERVNVFHELQRRGQAEAVGGLSFLVSLDDGLPKIFGLDDYAERIRSLAARRRLIQTAQGIIERGVLGTDSTAELIDAAQRDIGALTGTNATRSKLLSVGEIISAAGISEFVTPGTSVGPGVPIPWPSVAELIPDLRPGQLIIVAARPGMGKTALAAQIGANAAQQGHGVAMFSLEMGSIDIVRRLACGRAGIDSHRARLGRLDQSGRAALQGAAAELADLPLYLDDQTGATAGAVSAAVRALHARRKVGLLVIDYLQLMSSPGGRENRNVEVSDLSRGLKRLAREMRIPILCLSQLSRDSEKQGRRPYLSDLRDSGSIEQDADVVIFLHQAERDLNAPVIETEVLVAKHRGGPQGKRTLGFHRALTLFREMPGLL